MQKPTKKEAEDGAAEKLVFGPKCVVARDGQSAGIAAVMDGDRPTDIEMSRCEVLVRPFS